MPEQAEQTSSHLLTADQWMERLKTATAQIKQEIATNILECDDIKIYDYRAEWRVLSRMVMAMQAEINRDE